jgi:hypothetical protein
MTFEDVTVYAAIAGLAMIVIGAFLLALFPAWGGFRPQGVEEQQSALEKLIAALVQAFTSFLEIVKDVVTAKAGKYHPGQVLIAIGFLLFLLAAILYIIALLV